MQEITDVEVEEASIDGELTGAKRQYLPYEIHWTCPKCGDDKVRDLSEYYLSYPVWNETYTEEVFCEDCDSVEPTGYIEIEPVLSVRVK